VSLCFGEGDLQTETERSTICDGLRMTTNFGMLNAIPGTLPKLGRS